MMADCAYARGIDHTLDFIALPAMLLTPGMPLIDAKEER
jgi:hypothetical protein